MTDPTGVWITQVTVSLRDSRGHIHSAQGQMLPGTLAQAAFDALRAEVLAAAKRTHQVLDAEVGESHDERRGGTPLVTSPSAAPTPDAGRGGTVAPPVQSSPSPAPEFHPATQVAQRAPEEMPLREWVKNQIARWEAMPNEGVRNTDGAWRGFLVVVIRDLGQKAWHDWPYLLDRPDGVKALEAWARRWNWKGPSEVRG